MTAVIMAAGMGTRFGQMTETIPKGFIPFNGKPMVVRSIETLIRCGIDRIIIGTGYKKEKYEALVNVYPQIECVYSPLYEQTNSMYTLYNCRQVIGNDNFILLESDLVFEDKAITSLLDCKYDNAMLISPVTKFQDQYYVEMNDRDELIACSTNKDELNHSGELVGIHKISSPFYKTLIDEYSKIVLTQPKLGYEYLLLDVSKHIQPMNVLKIDNLQWYEIDDIDDLRFAEDNIPIN